MATFLNLVLLHQHHHQFFLSSQTTHFRLKLNNDLKLAGSAAHILFSILSFTYGSTLAQMWADLDSVPKGTTHEIKLESIAKGTQSNIQDEIAELLRISMHIIQRARPRNIIFVISRVVLKIRSLALLL